MTKYKAKIFETREYDIEVESDNGLHALNKVKEIYEINSKNGSFNPNNAPIKKVDYDIIKKSGLVKDF